jgi:XRE family transcriptional regulator, regulator of sulfur utilization
MGEQGTSLGQRVRQYRESQGYTLSQLAKLSGVSRSYLYQVESGESSPTEEKLNAIAMALGVSIPDLLGINVEPTQISQSLKEFAEQANLPPEDIRMLARVSYRGKQPNSKEAWRFLYSVIKTTTESEEL